MTELDGLKLDANVNALKDEKQRIERMILEEKREAGYAIDAKYDEQLTATKIALNDAERAKREFVGSTSSHPWDGKKVMREQAVYHRFSSYQRGTETLYGIVEVVRTTSKFPENLKWGRPSLGTVIVRKMKKDGTASLQMHKCHGQLETKWSLVEDAQ